MVDFIRTDLPRIGPGLGPRNKIWTKVKDKIIHENKVGSIGILEFERLTSLASGKRWLDMIPPEWIDIYGALYDESKYFVIDPHERSKIDKDVNRTFSLFTRNARLLRLQFKINMNGYAKALQTVLMAASHERGYCQGVNFLAAVFLLYEASEKDSFTLLCYLLKQRYVEILYNPKCSSLLEYMNYFEKRLRVHNKRVYKHFKVVDFSPICYAVEWFTTCFIVTCPGELSSCVLDLLLIGFDDIMIRVGLAMLDHLEEELLPLDLESLQLQFKSLTASADPYDVMFRALTIVVPSNTRQNILQTMAANIESMNPKAEFVNTIRGANGIVDEVSTTLNCSVILNTDADGRPLSTSTNGTGSTDRGSDHADLLSAYFSLADDEQCATELSVRNRNRRSELVFKLSSSTSSRIYPASTVSEKSCSAGSSRKMCTGKVKTGTKRRKRQGVLNLLSRSVTSDSVTAAAVKQDLVKTAGRSGKKIRRIGRVDVLLSDTFEALIPVRQNQKGGVANDLSDWDWDLVTDGHKKLAATDKPPLAKQTTRPRASIFGLHLTVHGGHKGGRNTKQQSSAVNIAVPLVETPHIRHASRSHLIFGNIFNKSSSSSAVKIAPRVPLANLSEKPPAAIDPITVRRVGSNNQLAGAVWFDKLVKDALWLLNPHMPTLVSQTSDSPSIIAAASSTAEGSTGTPSDANSIMVGYEADEDCESILRVRRVAKGAARDGGWRSSLQSPCRPPLRSGGGNVTIFASSLSEDEECVDLVGAMSEDWFGPETRSEKTRSAAVRSETSIGVHDMKVGSVGQSARVLPSNNRAVRKLRNKKRSFRRKLPNITDVQIRDM